MLQGMIQKRRHGLSETLSGYDDKAHTPVQYDARTRAARS